MNFITDNLLSIVPLIIGMTCFFAGLWAVFEKANRPGWAAVVPLYNMIVLHQISGKPVWWVVVEFVCAACAPVTLVLFLLLSLELARRFGKGGGFGVGLCFLTPLFLPVLGFGSSEYKVPV